jgi:glycosyltransferase involved in cell wall biosynthesis
VNNKGLPRSDFHKILLRMVSTLKSMRFVSSNNVRTQNKYIFAVSPTFWYAFPVALTGRLFGFKVVFEYNDLPLLEHGEGSDLKLFKRLYLKSGEYLNYEYGPKHLSGIVSITNQLNEHFKKKFPLTRRLVLPLNADYGRIEVGKIGREKVSGNIELVYSGSYFEFESVNDVLDAFKVIRATYPHVNLTLTGDIPISGWEDTKSYARAIGVGETVRFTGMIPYDDYVRTIRIADILVLPKNKNVINESNFPTKLGEYMATGNPVIAGRTPVLNDFLFHQETVVFYKPGDIKSFVKAIKYLLENPVKRKEIGLRAREYAEEAFDYRNNAMRLCDFFHDLS